MTQDVIIEMVRDAGLVWHKGWTLEDGEPNRFETFAKLVASQYEQEIQDLKDEILNLMERQDDTR